MKQFFPFLLFVTFFIAGCGPQGVLYEYQGTDIIFGTGGGFSGQVSEYRLTANGNLEVSESIASMPAKLPNVKKSNLKKIYNQLSDMDFETIDFKHPGNMYYFIKQDNGNSIHEVVWGDPNQPVADEVQSLYDLLVSSMN